MSENAPAPSATPFQSDTSGMGETQKAAMEFIDQTRSALAANLGNLQLREKHREALGHALRGEPAPGWLTPKSAAQLEAEARPIDADWVAGLQSAFQPMQQADIETLVSHATMATSLPREHAEQAATFALEAKLPAQIAKGLIDRLAHHRQHGGGLDAPPLDAAEQEDLRTECIRSLGGSERAMNEVRLARAYLEQVGGARLLAQIDDKSGSIGFDPRVILSLSMMARSRGLT